MAQGLGMNVVAYDIYHVEGIECETMHYVTMDELLAQSDFISLHTPAIDGKPLINRENIAKMKDGVIFVNTGRGGLVDTQALIRGILSGKIGAAGLDVYDEEGPNVYQDRAGEIIDSVTSRLCSFPNVVMTSHQAFFTKEALGEIARVTLDNAQAFANGTDFVERSVVC